MNSIFIGFVYVGVYKMYIHLIIGLRYVVVRKKVNK